MNKLTVLGLAACIFLAGCSTPYQNMGLTGGVEVTQFDATTLRIAGRGNGFTAPETIQNYVMLKAAEETQRLGYDMFLVVGENDTAQTGFVAMPSTSTSYTSGSATAYGNGNYANVYGNSTTRTYTTPGAIIPYSKPRTNIVIKLFKGQKPADAPPNLFVAADIIQYLGPQVKGARN